MFSLTAEFPEVRDSYTLYRVVPAAVTEEQVREVAGRFGLSGEPGAMNKRTGEFLLIDASKDPEEQVSVYAHSGAVAYHIPDLELPTEVTDQPDLPSDAEAEKIALAFLEKTGMQSPDARVVKIEVNQMQEIWEAGATEPKVSYDVTKAVRFGRSLDGLPVYGDEFAVILGDGGGVAGLVKTWREVEPDGNVSLRSPEEAYEDLRATRTVRPHTGQEYDQITIENVAIGYWMEPRGFVQDLIRPVYAFSGTALRDGVPEPYVEYVFADEGKQ
ncbi:MULTISPECIES: calcium-dependent protein kinase [unclassified Methanoculleus]|nr:MULTISPECIES: calcium-dependent protein kinase [unclassified Methanoculleus]MDD3215385.1 calcium-dependent protein kinase [Methanoculleus sp.]MDD4469987.1 calcium-dependent protein kinase [Methanoculleus sp.]